MPTLEREDFYRANDEVKELLAGVHARLDAQNGRLRTAEVNIATTTLIANALARLVWASIAGISTALVGLFAWMVRHIVFGAG